MSSYCHVKTGVHPAQLLPEFRFVLSYDRNRNKKSMSRMPFNVKDALQAQLNQSLIFTNCLGVNVAINDEKHGLWLGSGGFSDIDAQKNLDINQLFYIYSITKTFVSVCLLRLVQDGFLNLDDAVNQWLPNISFLKLFIITNGKLGFLATIFQELYATALFGKCLQNLG
ncbi:MAG: serine hydrolase [Cyanobacteria bacterium P01_D01_bin.50]